MGKGARHRSLSSEDYVKIDPNSGSMSDSDFEKTVEQEVKRLRLLHPMPDDVPGCLTAFDDYLACNVIRTQVKNLYRYGERTNCDRKFQDFKFCLTTKMMHPEERREAWIRRRAEWWANRRVGGCCEDVWDIRDTPLPNFPRPITAEVIQEQLYK